MKDFKPKRYVREYANDLIKRLKSYDYLGNERINEGIDYYNIIVREYERNYISACEAVQALTEYSI